MFTGIVEELGFFKKISRTGSGAVLAVESKICLSDAKIGDSISINGACLTVVGIKGSDISFDVSEETFKRTNIGKLKPGERVNIERSLMADSRLGGHFVTGHIDCIGKIVKKDRQGEYFNIEIEIPTIFMNYLVEKGSVAIDGISLTVNSIGKKSFSLMIIPHTLSLTTLADKGRVDIVNIEVDILAKYVEKFTSNTLKYPKRQPANITKNLLKDHGFI